MQLNVLDDLAEAMKVLDGKKRNHPDWNEHVDELTFHAKLTPVCLNSAVMHRT